MQHPDEGLIHTWLDGELPADEAASLEAHIAECAECSAKVAEARGLIAASSRIVSALDIVPGGVIPSGVSKQRPWYVNTQFRAAAAVMIVAGASFLVMQNRDKGAMDRIVSTTTEASALQDRVDTSSPGRDMNLESVRPADAVASAPVIAPKKAAQQPERPVPSSRPVTPPAPLPAPQMNEATALSGRVEGVTADRRAFTGVLGGVARGVELGSAPGLKKIRSDSIASVSHTVFQVSPGVEVTLTDTPMPVTQQRVAQRKEVSAAASPPAATVTAAPQADAANAPTINTISWTDKRGHSMTLTGPFPKERLEMLRKLLPEDQR